jgi:hypothetical protein
VGFGIIHVMIVQNQALLASCLQLVQTAAAGSGDLSVLVTQVFRGVINVFKGKHIDGIAACCTVACESQEPAQRIKITQEIYKAVIYESNWAALELFLGLNRKEDVERLRELLRAGKSDAFYLNNPPPGLHVKLPFLTRVGEIPPPTLQSMPPLARETRDIQPGAGFLDIVAHLLEESPEGGSGTPPDWANGLNSNEEFVAAVAPLLETLIGIRMLDDSSRFQVAVESGPVTGVLGRRAVVATEYQSLQLRPQFCARIICVLIAAEHNTGFRERFRLQALKALETCGNGAANVLTDIELILKMHEIGDDHWTERFRLFKREYLREKIGEFCLTQLSDPRIDNLAFRWALTMRLTRRFPSLGEPIFAVETTYYTLTDEFVSLAAGWLKPVEADNEEFVNFLVANEFWAEKLSTVFQIEKGAVLEGFSTELSRLEERQATTGLSVPEKEYLEHVEAISRRRKEAENEWYLNKTRELYRATA